MRGVVLQTSGFRCKTTKRIYRSDITKRMWKSTSNLTTFLDVVALMCRVNKRFAGLIVRDDRCESLLLMCVHGQRYMHNVANQEQATHIIEVLARSMPEPCINSLIRIGEREDESSYTLMHLVSYTLSKLISATRPTGVTLELIDKCLHHEKTMIKTPNYQPQVLDVMSSENTISNYIVESSLSRTVMVLLTHIDQQGRLHEFNMSLQALNNLIKRPSVCEVSISDMILTILGTYH